MRVMRTATLLAALALSMVTLSARDEWANFRGPSAGAVTDNPQLPDHWSATENIAWKTDVPGLGWSSPIVWDDFIFVTAVKSDDPIPVPGQDIIEDGKVPNYKGGMNREAKGIYTWVLYALDFNTGKIRWQRDLYSGTPQEKRHPKNTYASETPVTDGKRVYVYHASAGLFAVDFKGKIVWSKKVTPPTIRMDVKTKGSVLTDTGGPQNDIAAMFANLGAAASPAIYRDRIFITSDHEPRVWMMAAFNTEDGTEIWRHEEPKLEQAYGWSTPFVWQNERRTEIVAAGDQRIRSFDPDGTPLWSLKGLSVNTSPTPFASNGLLYVTSGYPGTPLRPVYAIKPGASGDISLPEGKTSSDYIAWSQRAAATYMPSALVYKGQMYNLYSQGFITAHDAATGDQVYGRKRIDSAASGFTASPWAYNGKVFAASEDGDTYVIQAGPDYKVIGKNSLGEMIIATPAVVRNSVIMRTVGRVYRIARK